MCDGIHYGEVEDCSLWRGGLVAVVLHVWLKILRHCTFVRIVFHIHNQNCLCRELSTVNGLWLRLLLFATHGAPPTTVPNGAGMCLV